MAITFIEYQKNYGNSASVVVPAFSAAIDDNDLLVYAVATWNLTEPGRPAGFNVWAFNKPYNDRRIEIGYKWASSESGTYTFTGSTYMSAIICAYRGVLGAGSGDPKDVISNTTYTISNTTVRAAAMTLTTACTVVWVGFTTLNNLTDPGTFNTRATETAGSGWELCMGDLEFAAGDTTIQDGASDTGQSKHAFMVGIKPAGVAAPTITATQVSSDIQVSWV